MPPKKIPTLGKQKRNPAEDSASARARVKAQGEGAIGRVLREPQNFVNEIYVKNLCENNNTGMQFRDLSARAKRTLLIHEHIGLITYEV